jgi:type IV pilus assembly protein PilY1
MPEIAARPVWGKRLPMGLLLMLMGTPLALADAAFVSAEQPIGYVAQVELSHDDLRAGGAVVFHGQFERTSWSGNLWAQKFDAAGNIDGDATWWPGGAAAMLDAQNHDTGRRIATMKDDGTGVGFRWNQLSETQRASLGNQRILDFLRGDRSHESSTRSKALRQRASVLGDIVHSRPYLVHDSANPTIFVGANDGMLHAINAACASAVRASGCDADGGKERWAYVPSMLLPRMKRLSVEPYVHDYYVDGQLNVKTIAAGSKRILVGGLGAGGMGLFALDITGSAGLVASSEAELARKVLWEVTPTTVNHARPALPNAYVNLGYTFGSITLAKVAKADAVIVGNGYNDGSGAYERCDHATPGYANCGGDYQAYLYVINALTGQLISAIKAGSSGSATRPNGLSTPVAIDQDGDGSVDIVYAGDLHGTMWKFDLARATASALLVTSPAQAITSTPAVGIHPGGGTMVNFATGRMRTPADMEDSATHYAYGIWDGAPAANTELLTQTMAVRDVTYGAVVQRVRRVTANPPAWRSGPVRHKGWRVALLGAERVLGEGSFLESGRYYFNAYDPTARAGRSGSAGPVGSNTMLELDYLTGGSPRQPFLDLSGKARPGDDDRIRYEAGDTMAPGRKVGDPIMSTDGIPVGRFIADGVSSQPVLARLGPLSEVLFNLDAHVGLPLPDMERRPKSQAASQGIRSGGRERGWRARTGRISWQELVAP